MGWTEAASTFEVLTVVFHDSLSMTQSKLKSVATFIGFGHTNSIISVDGPVVPMQCALCIIRAVYPKENTKKT
jgi:hypothetical protein